jgi:hypothetical protein
MDAAETCVICGRPGIGREPLAAWFGESGRQTIHLECWSARRAAADPDDRAGSVDAQG